MQEKVDNGQTFSGPSAGKERPPVNGPRAGDEREKNKDSVRSDVDIAQADENMAAPSENTASTISIKTMMIFLMKMVEKKKRRRKIKVLMW